MMTRRKIRSLENIVKGSKVYIKLLNPYTIIVDQRYRFSYYGNGRGHCNNLRTTEE